MPYLGRPIADEPEVQRHHRVHRLDVDRRGVVSRLVLLNAGVHPDDVLVWQHEVQPVVERHLLDVAEHGDHTDVAGIDHHEAREHDDEQPQEHTAALHGAADGGQRQSRSRRVVDLSRHRHEDSADEETADDQHCREDQLAHLFLPCLTQLFPTS